MFYFKIILINHISFSINFNHKDKYVILPLNLLKYFFYVTFIKSFINFYKFYL